MQPIARNEIRDRVRRRIGRSTAIEAGTAIGDPQAFGGVGQPHPNQPAPTNIAINDWIEETVADINVRCRLGGADRVIDVDIPAQTANGPYRVDLETGVLPRQGSINEVLRAWWETFPALLWTHFRELDANQIDYMQYPPGIPQWGWTTKMGLFLLPSPGSSGTLHLLVGNSIWAPTSDTDTIRQLPGDHYPLVIDGAALRACDQQPDDAVMAARRPAIEQSYERGILKLQSAMNTMTPFQPRFIVAPYRYRRGGR